MTTTQQERIKYARMWTEVDGYRRTSPGEQLVPYFLRVADWKPGDTLIDLGCGPGRASALLAEQGLKVYQLDITETSRDPKVKAIGLPFIECSLWEMPELFKFDWLYCTDVLEHIPTDRVDATLDCMARITGKGAFMQIALFPEVFGRHIGETLHLTVKPADWWQAKILKRWQCDGFNIASHLIALTRGPK